MFTTFKDIVNSGYTLSASQYKAFSIANTNIHPLSYFLDRSLERCDLGNEVGSENYIDNSQYKFIKTRALQPESFLLDTTGEGMSLITPKNFVDMKLKKGDIIISKDSNVGEAIILDEDYPLTMLC
jgi:type I restriction enzyme S subunit